MAAVNNPGGMGGGGGVDHTELNALKSALNRSDGDSIPYMRGSEAKLGSTPYWLCANNEMLCRIDHQLESHLAKIYVLVKDLDCDLFFEVAAIGSICRLVPIIKARNYLRERGVVRESSESDSSDSA